MQLSLFLVVSGNNLSVQCFTFACSMLGDTFAAVLQQCLFGSGNKSLLKASIRWKSGREPSVLPISGWLTPVLIAEHEALARQINI